MKIFKLNELLHDETNTENVSLYNFCLMIQDKALVSRESFTNVRHVCLIIQYKANTNNYLFLSTQ
jgi:hypothetical protein